MPARLDSVSGRFQCQPGGLGSAQHQNVARHPNACAHVVIRPPEGGLRMDSARLCEPVRSISKERLAVKKGRVTPQTLAEVEDRVRILLEL